MKKVYLFISLLIPVALLAQNEDSLDNTRLARMIQLSEVVVRNNLDIDRFIEQVRNDTTFYKAFRNLRVLGFTSLNDIRMMDKKGRMKAALWSRTRQRVMNGCRTMKVLNDSSSGNFFERDGDYRYYTAALYASLFFTEGEVCGETNVVKDAARSVRSKRGIEKRKEQLKMLFFDPGKKIPGIPLMGDKMSIFGKEHMEDYNYSLEYVDYLEKPCYRFTIEAKDGKGVVIDKMITWFDSRTMNIMARNYDLSYRAGVYDFDVHMEVQMTTFDQLIVPSTLRYRGTWDMAFKKRERGVFTATLFDFTR